MRVQTATDLGLVIRERRQALGWDQQTLAAKAGVGRQWIVAIEQGKPRAAMGLVLRTLTALGLRVGVDPMTAPLTAAPMERTDDTGALDIDAVIERARAPRRPAPAAPSHRSRR
jgi:y4mF family transcriptional regulator